MVKRFKLTLLALFCFVVAGQFIWTGAEAQDQPAEKFFKNIKALKGVPAGQIAGLMDSYNKALGVSCEYCHLAGDLPNDTKPAHKLSVRDITMTREINDKYKHAVDCMSCHQGKAKPTTGVLATGKPTTGTPPGKTEPTKTEPKKTEPAKTEPTKTEPQSSGMGPDSISFRAIALGASKVAFPHAKHIEIVSSDCSKCHHTGDTGKCDGCHKHNSGDAGLSFKKVGHSTKERGCAGCHIQNKSGPTKCAECHKK